LGCEVYCTGLEAAALKAQTRRASPFQPDRFERRAIDTPPAPRYNLLA
jgi:hypothetical protein